MESWTTSLAGREEIEILWVRLYHLMNRVVHSDDFLCCQIPVYLIVSWIPACLAKNVHYKWYRECKEIFFVSWRFANKTLGYFRDYMRFYVLILLVTTIHFFWKFVVFFIASLQFAWYSFDSSDCETKLSASQSV